MKNYDERVTTAHRLQPTRAGSAARRAPGRRFLADAEGLSDAAASAKCAELQAALAKAFGAQKCGASALLRVLSGASVVGFGVSLER